MAPKKRSQAVTRPVSKKAKTQTLLSQDEIMSKIKAVKDNTEYNELVILLQQYTFVKKDLKDKENENIETIGRKLTVGLYQIFQMLFQQGLLRLQKKFDDKKVILVKWLINKYTEFKSIINEFLIEELSFKSSIQLDILDINLKLIKLESEYMKSKDESYFANETYKSLIQCFINSKIGLIASDNTFDNFIFLEFQEKFNKYYDLQYYFFQNIHEIVNQNMYSNTKQLFAIYYTLIKEPLKFHNHLDNLKACKSMVKNLPSSIYKTSSLKKVYQNALLSILSLKLSNSQYKSILLILNKRILPNLAQPTRLMDFLTDCYNTTDLIIQILSLNSLYELMKQYNLEYPDFYTKLYSLLTPSLLFNRYRSRFFRLTDLFLSSTHLSSQLVASFIKKLARLSITGPAPGVVIIIPFIYNLLKRHPSCMILIQNATPIEDYTDPYDNKETNPLKTNAINSSLWEIEALMNHYHPNISTLAKLFTEPFRKPSYNLEDFLDWSYKSLLDSEIKKNYKSMAALEYESWDHFINEDLESTYLNGWSL